MSGIMRNVVESILLIASMIALVCGPAWIETEGEHMTPPPYFSSNDALKPLGTNDSPFDYNRLYPRTQQ